MASTGQQCLSTSSEHNIQPGPFPIRSRQQLHLHTLERRGAESPFCKNPPAGYSYLTPELKHKHKNRTRSYSCRSLRFWLRQYEIGTRGSNLESARKKLIGRLQHKRLAGQSSQHGSWTQKAVCVSFISRYVPLLHRTHVCNSNASHRRWTVYLLTGY